MKTKIQRTTDSKLIYHLAAIIAVVIWSMTYINTQILIKTYSALDIALIRFSLGFIALSLIKPVLLKQMFSNFSLKRDIYYILAGFFGIFLYYFLEIQAAEFTHASNISFIASSIPLVTIILAHFINRDEKLSYKAPLAFMMSLAGMALLSFSNGGKMAVFWKGDLLALGAVFAFSAYNIVLRRLDGKDSVLMQSWKCLFYGLLFLLPINLFTQKSRILEAFTDWNSLPHFLFLGIMASTVCVILWNLAIRNLGAGRASHYIYFVPVIAGGLSFLLTDDSPGILKISGMVIILIAAFLGDKKKSK